MEGEDSEGVTPAIRIDAWIRLVYDESHLQQGLVDRTVREIGAHRQVVQTLLKLLHNSSPFSSRSCLLEAVLTYTSSSIFA